MSEVAEREGQRWVALTTYGAGGEPVVAPVHVVALSDGRLGFATGSGSEEAERLRHDPRVEVQPCTGRGEALPGGSPAPATAETVRSGPLFDEVRDRVRASSVVRWHLDRARSALRRVPHADAVVLVHLDEDQGSS